MTEGSLNAGISESADVLLSCVIDGLRYSLFIDGYW